MNHEMITEFERRDGAQVRVIRKDVPTPCGYMINTVYDVVVNGVPFHPDCSPEDVMRTLSNMVRHHNRS